MCCHTTAAQNPRYAQSSLRTARPRLPVLRRATHRWFSFYRRRWWSHGTASLVAAAFRRIRWPPLGSLVLSPQSRPQASCPTRRSSGPASGRPLSSTLGAVRCPVQIPRSCLSPWGSALLVRNRRYTPRRTRRSVRAHVLALPPVPGYARRSPCRRGVYTRFSTRPAAVGQRAGNASYHLCAVVLPSRCRTGSSPANASTLKYVCHVQALSLSCITPNHSLHRTASGGR